MAKPVETELKLRFSDPRQWTRLLTSSWVRQLSGEATPVEQELCSTYFDTADLRLQQRGIAFRLRQEQERWTATVKAGGHAAAGLHQREEWNMPAPGPVPDPNLFQHTTVGPIITKTIDGAPLTPLFTTRFTRHLLNIATAAGDKIELSADRGEIMAGERREPILEVELELKAGKPTALLAIGAALARQFPCLLENRSKYLRALRLAGLATDSVDSVPSPPRISNDMDTATALTDLLIYHIQCLATMQERLLTAPHEPENLHQLRVQLRQLRALWSFAKPLIAADSYSSSQEELRQWSHQMGTVREWDVLLAAWQGLQAHDKIPASPGALADTLHRRRETALQQLHRTSASGAFTPVILELWSWLAERNLYASPDSNTLIGDYARRRLRRWYRQLLKRGERFSSADAATLHHLRISGKRLRYSLEDLTDILPSSWERLSARLKSLQDSLGLLHDADVATTLLDTALGRQPSRVLCREAGLLTGWYAGRSPAVKKQCEKQWAKITSQACKDAAWH